MPIRHALPFLLVLSACVSGTRPGTDSIDSGVEDAGLDGGGGSSDDGGPPDAGDAGAGLRVLFIGDSYTYVNDLPGMLHQIAATSGVPPSIATDSLTQGGASLYDLWNAGAPAKIAGQHWTHVVLQGQSLEPLPIFGASAGFFQYAAMFGDLVTTVGAVPVFYATWARAAGDPSYGANGYFQTPAEMQDELTAAYAQAAKAQSGSILVCVGEAFQRAIARHPEIALQQSDLSHPTVAGTYLAASTFYVALAGQPVPAQSTVPAGLSPDDAASLRTIAEVGTDCADVQVLAAVGWSLGFDVDGGGPFDFGTAGVPISTDIALTNSGGTAAGLSDGMALAPPFEWTSGSAFPGGAGISEQTGLPYCGPMLDAGDSCALSVTYTAASTATGTFEVNTRGAYLPSLNRTLSGEATDRAFLTISDTPGFFGCTDTCGPHGVTAWPGATVETTLFVLNRGAAGVTALGEGAPLTAPFAWADGGFPGGTGSLIAIEGEPPLPYCGGTLAPGDQCVITLTFTPPDDGGEATATVDLAYSDSQGPVVPDATRQLEGWESKLAP